MNRRPALAAIMLSAAALAYHAFVVEPRRLVSQEVDVSIDDLPQGLSGTRLALVSDLHLGAPGFGPSQIRALTEALNAARPDAVLLLGDFTYHGLFGRRVTADQVAAVFSGVSAPKFAVFGNHDLWFDEAADLRGAFARAGIRLLENDAAALRPEGRGGAQIWLAGVAYLHPRPWKIASMLEERVPRGAPVVVMTHDPDDFPDVPPSATLTVAGHTHGGQIVFPLLGALYVPSRYYRRYLGGYYEEGGKRLFVTTGLGTSILPARLGVTPEIAVLTLRAAAPFHSASKR